MFQYNGICGLLEYKICSKVGVIITFPDSEVLRTKKFWEESRRVNGAN